MSNSQNTHRLELPPEAEPARAFIEALVARYEARIKALEEKIEKLTPRNSSMPPSTEHPHARPERKTPGSGRKQGGQKGHKRNVRPLIPTEQCSQVIPCIAEHCRRCGDVLSGRDPEPIRHQVWELPEIHPIVTEYQLERRFCPCCGITTCGQLPTGVPSGQCGPRLAAFVGLLMGHFRQSKRRTTAFLEDLLNIPCSTGWIVKIQTGVSGVLAGPYEELRGELGQQAQLFIDESPTKQKNDKAWLWVTVAPMFVVFGIFLSRKRDALKAMVGDYSGIIINCDRAKMYFDGQRLQWCWSHLKRDFQKLFDSHDQQVKRLGSDLLRQQKLLFQHWRQYKEGKIQWKSFQELVAPVCQQVNNLLLRGRFSGNRRLVGMCDELYNHRDWLWTFTEVEGTEPTNNAAERALRPAVIYRKLSFGTQSASGSRYLERILTVTQTCHLQRRSPYQYLISAMEAAFAGRPAPSLLPSPNAAQAAT